jgi:hypothetical protein
MCYQGRDCEPLEFHCIAKSYLSSTVLVCLLKTQGVGWLATCSIITWSKREKLQALINGPILEPSGSVVIIKYITRLRRYHHTELIESLLGPHLIKC